MSLGEGLMRPGLIVKVGPPALLTLVVLGAGLAPSVPRVPLAIEWADKVEHAIVFSLVAYCYMRAARHIWPQALPSLLRVRAAFGAVALGASLEILQALVPHRTAELLDLVADAVGALIALVAMRFSDDSVATSHG
jgi:VanZ family protein